jgi:hypothetical protein
MRLKSPAQKIHCPTNTSKKKRLERAKIRERSKELQSDD